MRSSMSLVRRAARWIGPVFAVLMLGVVVLGGFHHHSGLSDHHPCALCSAAHAPAVTSSSAPALGAPVARSHRLTSPDLEPRARFAARGIASRAPPAA